MEDYKEKYEKLHKETLAALQQRVSEGRITEEIARSICADFVKKSEDEKIRKELISLFQDGRDCVNHRYTGSDCIRWISWLEKQGEKIDVIENFDTEFEKQVSHLIASAINKEHEYNQSYVKWTANALLYYAKHELEKQGEQNPAWSKEDERNLEKAIECCTNRDFVFQTVEEQLSFLDWLKSLKEKMKGE